MDDEDIAELYRVFHDLTGWVPTEAEKAATRTAEPISTAPGALMRRRRAAYESGRRPGPPSK